MDAPEIFLKHEPDMSQEIKIEISKIKDDLGSITLTGEGPQILIYHTHSREAYKLIRKILIKQLRHSDATIWIIQWLRWGMYCQGIWSPRVFPFYTIVPNMNREIMQQHM